jgi:hypothetical protein
MESSGPPTTHPRTFPHPLEIPAFHPPPGISTVTHSLGGEDRQKKKEKKNANANSSISDPGRWPPLPTTRSSSTLNLDGSLPHQLADAHSPARRSPLVWTATTSPTDHPRELHRPCRTATSPTKTLTHKPPRSINPSSWTAPSPRAAGRKRPRSTPTSRVDGDDQPYRPPAQAPSSILDGKLLTTR